jgi:hypothetical protein
MRRRTLILGAAAATAAPMVAAGHGRLFASGPPRMRGVPGVEPMRLWRVMPAVSVKIAGQGPFTLGVDTGAFEYLNITQAVAKAAGLVRIGSALSEDPSGKNPISVARYRVSELTFAGVTFLNVDAQEMPQFGGPGETLDGVIGMSLFDALTLTLDFKGRQIRLSREGLPPPDGDTIFAYDAGPYIQLPLQIGAVTMPTHLDTGQANAPLMVPEDLIARIATHGAPTKVGTARTVTQAMDVFSVALDAPVHLGAVTFPVTKVVYPTVVPLANLGSAALQAMTVTIDRPARRIRFTA